MFVMLNLFQHLSAQSPGSLDLSFDTDGKVTPDVGIGYAYGNSVVIQSDGKIVMAGSKSSGTNKDFALIRCYSNGSLDNTFDGDGRLTTDFGNYSYGRSVALQSDGKIVVAGTSTDGSGNDFALARYNIDGSLDTTFDSDGKLTTDILGSDDWGNSVAIQPDGKIVIAGMADNGPNFDFAIARYLSGLNVGLINFSLDNNSVFIYPNPIAQEAKLEYSLNTEENISISLMDMQVQLVKTFINNQKQEPGNYSQSLNFPEDLASGSYFIVISTPNAKVSVKVIK